MKTKWFIVICLVLLAGSPVFAANAQKVFPTDSEVYEAISLLYINQGISLPSGSGPWTADELDKMLSKITRTALSKGELNLYDYAKAEIHKTPENQPSPTLQSQFDVIASLEGYYHTNTTDFTDETDWRMDFEERAPLLLFPFETWATDLFYAYFAPSLEMNQFRDDQDTSSLFGDAAFTTNILMVPPSVLNDLSMNVPYRGTVSAGGENWNVQFGRDSLKWGQGETGSLILGDHMKYQDFLKATTYHDTFKFTSLVSFFTHPMNYYTTSGGPIAPEGQNESLNGIRLFIAHRVEFRMFDDLVNLAVSEGMMYMSEDNTINLGYLNPMMIFHDNYIRANSNSILALDLEIAPIEHVSLYGQFVVDEFALPGEPTSGAGTNPEAFGFLGGVKGAYIMDSGVAYGLFEAAKTDPYLYLRDPGDRNHSVGEYGLDYVIGIRNFSPDGNISIAQDFLGYEYGNDAIVMNLTGGYKSFGTFYVEGTAFYMLHGTHDMFTLWASGSDSDPDSSSAETPTDHPYSDGQYDNSARDAVETTLLLEVKAGMELLDNLSIYGQFDFINKQNPGNLSTAAPISDIQLSLGVSYTF